MFDLDLTNKWHLLGPFVQVAIVAVVVLFLVCCVVLIVTSARAGGEPKE
jgi:hypothetical protein